jgi:hypothetical protein
MGRGKDMSASKSSISRGESYREIGKFWDSHDLSQFWDKVRSARFEVEIESETTYYPVEASLSTALRSVARKRGVSPEVLLNMWLQERIRRAKK